MNLSRSVVLPPVVDKVCAIAIRDLWQVDYQLCWEAMRRFSQTRRVDTADEIWLVEHPPVYTQGIAGKPEHLLRGTTIPLIKTDRGGQITYHAPGQLILYPLLDLKRNKLGIRTLVRRIEEAVCQWLAAYNVKAYGKVEAPGVYVQLNDHEAKIASLGLKVRNGCTYHGVSVNLTLDLAPFTNINPCGYVGLQVTRLADLLAPEELPQLREAGLTLAALLAQLISTPEKHE